MEGLLAIEDDIDGRGATMPDEVLVLPDIGARLLEEKQDMLLSCEGLPERMEPLLGPARLELMYEAGRGCVESTGGDHGADMLGV